MTRAEVRLGPDRLDVSHEEGTPTLALAAFIVDV
jgi:hypothetical protein